MRIRKNSRLVINGRSSSTSLLICQLNRSPWDIDALSSQGEWGEGSFTRNGSMGDSSLYSGESMELSFEYMPPQSKQESNKSLEEDEIGSLNDGSGLKHPTLSDDYYSLTSSYRIPTATTKKAAGGGTPPVAVPPPAPKRRGRPRKAAEGATTANRCKLKNGADNADNVSEDDDVKVSMKKDNKMKGYIENVMDEELDYIESEEDEEEMDGGMRRRVRKPIKARSLKSLM